MYVLRGFVRSLCVSVCAFHAVTYMFVWLAFLARKLAQVRADNLWVRAQPIRSSAETGAHARVLRELRRYSRGSEFPISRFPLNRQSFRTYHLSEVTRILPAISATMFGVPRCATYLYCSSVFLGGCLVSVCVCYLSRSCVFWATLFGVCVTYIVFVFFWGEKKMVQRIMEVVADYEDCVNVTTSSAPAM